MKKDELAGKKLPELRIIAKAIGIKKVESYRKSELVDLISNNGQSTEKTSTEEVKSTPELFENEDKSPQKNQTVKEEPAIAASDKKEVKKEPRTTAVVSEKLETDSPKENTSTDTSN